MASQNKLTEKAQEAIIAAQDLATSQNNTQLEPEHLFKALVIQEGGVVPAILQKLGLQPSIVLQRLQPSIDALPRASGPTELRMSPNFKRVWDAAREEADRLKDDYVSTEHFLLALTDQSKGALGQLLQEQGITRDRLYQALQEVRGGQRVTSASPEATYEALLKYGRDLTHLARQGKLDPVIGRDEEIRRTSRC